jgi:hypothetical protein
MRRNVLIILISFSVMSAFAQQAPQNSEATSGRLHLRKRVVRPEDKGWYIYASGAFGIPFLSTNKFSPFKEVGNKDWFQSDSSLSVRPLYGTLGGGWAVNFGWGHMFNKFIGIDVLHTIAFHPEQPDARINTNVTLSNGNKASYFAEEYTKIFAVYINPHLVMHWDNEKRFGITGKAGLCIPIGGAPVSKARIIDHSGRLLESLAGLPILPITLLSDYSMEYTATAKTKLRPTVGLSASIAIDVRLFKNVWAFAEVRVHAFTISPRETNFSEFSLKTESPILPLIQAISPIPLNIESADAAPEFLKHFVYKNELTEASNTLRYTTELNLKKIDINKPMEEPGLKFNASTMYFNLGMRVNFTQHWTKKRSAKVMPRREAHKAAKATS